MANDLRARVADYLRPRRGRWSPTAVRAFVIIVIASFVATFVVLSLL